MKPILFLLIVITFMSVSTIGITVAQIAPVLDLQYAFFKTDKEEYKIQYNITNGRLEGTFVDIPARAFMFLVNATDDGQLSVDLPRKIIDSTRDGKDRPYFVFRGDPTGSGLKRIKVDEISHNLETRIVTINFIKGLNQVQLSGTFFVEHNYPGTNLHLYNGVMSPLEQWQLGADSLDVICKNGFQLIIKASDDLPACVKPLTAAKLLQRGWGDYNPQLSKDQQLIITNLATQDHSVQKLLSGKDWYVRAIQSGVSLGNDCPFGSCYSILIDQVDSNHTLVALVNLATKKVIDVRTTPGW